MNELVKKLIELKKTISTMESCTGGAIVNAITNIEGSSEIIKFSAVTYSNEYKIKMGVNKNIIDTYSVYSIETADEMSKNISLFTKSDYGIGITGKLNRNDPNNLFGDDNTVFISIYDKGRDIFEHKIIKVNLTSREENKKFIVEKVKDLLLSILSN